jgi:hypothetical protein
MTEKRIFQMYLAKAPSTQRYIGIRRIGFSREFPAHSREQFAAEAAPTHTMKSLCVLGAFAREKQHI